MRVPYSWLREHCDPGLGAAELAERLAMTGTEVERVDAGRPALGRGLRRRQGLTAEEHPDADRLSVCTVDTGDGEPRTIVCGAPNVAAGQTVAVALPGARMPGGEKLRKAKLRGVASEGMILSATELEIGEESDGILVLDDGAGAGHAAGRGAAARRAGARARGDPEPGRLLRRLRRRPRGPRDHRRRRSRAEPWTEDAAAERRGGGRPTSPRSRSRYPISARDSPPGSSPRSTIGPSPPWLQARLTAAGQRPINNVVDITNYVMLLTAQPLHAFDLDKVPGGALIVRAAAEGEKMTTLDGVERALRRRDRARLRRERALGDRRDHGRPGLRGLRGDDPRPARGRELERDQHPPHLAPARPPLGGLLALREAAPPGPLHAGPADRLAADGRALRREAGAGDDRRRRRAAAARAARPARRPGRAACSGWRSRRPTRPPTSSGSGSASRPTARTSQVDGPARPPLRRHPRGRPDRGGRPRPRPRRAPAVDPARRGRAGRRPEPRAAAAPPRRGHAARPRLRRGRRLELHRPRRGRRGCGSPTTTRAPRRSRSPTRSPRTSR